ncbi:hypothetical protein ACFPN1_16225 [Lysobacter yangpyeongensis]|uniref:Uncharacterized protein n=1 Tax=Lysobacter yangpyeongensis TaxID=346182 RepID=A0ABW0SST1_9GAMM
MDMPPLESELIAALDHHDELVRLCAAGRLSFWDFCAAYDNFYWAYALDGHESDPDGQAVLDKLADRIAPHRDLAETVLANVCSDHDPDKGSYGKAGRFGPDEAVIRLKLVAVGLPRDEA